MREKRKAPDRAYLKTIKNRTPIDANRTVGSIYLPWLNKTIQCEIYVDQTERNPRYKLFFEEEEAAVLLPLNVYSKGYISKSLVDEVLGTKP